MKRFHLHSCCRWLSSSTTLLLLLYSRVASSTPCTRDDATCWTMQARQYTNDVRARHGMKKDLRDGPETQLANARMYAGRLAGLGKLQHQLLGAVTKQVGCGRWIGGENIAFNMESSEEVDVARACVDQWEKSPPHLANLLQEWFDEVAVGFHFHSDGRVYCVQTFASVSAPELAKFDAVNGCAVVVAAVKTPTPQATDSPSAPADEDESADDIGVVIYDDAEQENSPNTDDTQQDNVPNTDDVDQSTPPPEEEYGQDYNNEDEDNEDDGDYKTDVQKLEQTQRRRDNMHGDRSCRCLELNGQCWKSLRAKSGGACLPFTLAFRQPLACRKMCCEYCEMYGAESPRCSSSIVNFVCHALFA